MNLAGMRPKILKPLKPLFEPVSNLGLSPNELTSLGFLFGIGSVIAYGSGYFVLGALLLITHSFMDLCDGYTARNKNRWTLFGGVYEGLIDRYVNALIIVAITVSIYHYGLYAVLIGFLAVTGSLVNSFSKVATYAETQDVKKDRGKILHPMDSVGFFGLAETIIVIVIFSLIAETLSSGYMIHCLIIIAVCTHISLIQRVLFVYRKYNHH